MKRFSKLMAVLLAMILILESFSTVALATTPDLGTTTDVIMTSESEELSVPEETEPVNEETEPATEETEPVTEETEPVTEETEPVTEETEPVTEETEPVTEETEPVTEEPELSVPEDIEPPVSEETEFLVVDTDPVNASVSMTEDGFVYEILDDLTVMITGYTGTEKDIVTPSEIEGKPVTAIGTEAFRGKPFNSVVISEGVTHIGNSAFYHCNTMQEITLPETLTSLGNLTFAGCSSLKRVTIPEGVTALPDKLFSSCYYLEEVILPEGLLTIGVEAFRNSEHLKEVIIPKTVTSIGELAFGGCNKLTQMEIPDGVTTLGAYAFDYCYGLKSVVIGDGVTCIEENTFARCTRLERITIGRNIKQIKENAFDRCTALIELELKDLENWLTISLHDPAGASNPLNANTKRKKMYLNGEPLTDLVIPEGCMNIREYAFTLCDSLQKVYIPSSVTQIGKYAFCSCFQLSEIHLHDLKAWAEGEEKYSNSASNYVPKRLFLNGEHITELKIPDGVQVIGADAFAHMAELEQVEISDSVTKLDYGAFDGCSGLTTVKFGTGLEQTYTPFRGCDNLTNIYIKDVASWFNAFGTSIDPFNENSAKPKKLYIGDELATKAVVPGSCPEIPWRAFYGMSNITEVVVEEGVTEIDYEAFMCCSGLERITLPDTLTSINIRAFSGCAKLQKIVIPDSVQQLLMDVFSDCSALKSVVWSRGLTSIPEKTFDNCSSLKCVAVPESVTFIDINAFRNCNNLDCMVYEGTESMLQMIEVDSDGNNALFDVGWHIEGTCCQTSITVTRDASTGMPRISYKEKPCILAYAVYRATKSGGDYTFLDLSYDLSYVDQDAEYEKKYYYVVVGVSGFGMGGPPSEEKNITTPCAVPLPTVTNDSSGYPKITWEKVSGAKEYQVYYSTTENGSYLKLGSTTKTAYTHSKAASGKGYYYKVKAIGSSSSLNSNFSEPVYGFRKLAVPGMTVTANHDASNVKLTWKKIDGATGYELQCKVNDGEFETIETLTALNFTHKNLVVGNTYTYRLRALCDNTEAISDYSAEKAETIKCGKPIVTVGYSESGKPILSWSRIQGAAAYEIQYATSSKGKYQQLAVIEGTKFTHTEAVGAKTYYYKVCAIDANGNTGAYSSNKSVVCCCEAPNLKETSYNSSGYPIISWSKVEGAKKYEVYCSTSAYSGYKKLATTSSTSYTHSKASVGKEYYYQVRAYGSSTASISAFSQVAYAVRKLAQPSITIAANFDNGTAKISWKKISGAIGYELQCKTNDGSFESLGEVTGTSYTHENLVVGNIYTYRLSALSKTEEATSIYSAEKAVTIKCGRPVLSVDYDENGKPILLWADVEGAVTYEIQMATSAKGKYTQLGIIDGTNYWHGEAVGAKTYYYKVRAIDANGNAGDYCAYKSVICKCEAPNTIETTTNSSGYPQVKWGKVTGAKKYEVWYATEATGTYKKLTTTSSTSYTYSKAKMDTEYYFKVRAYGGSTSSLGEFSDVVMGLRKLAQPSISLTANQSDREITVKWKKVANAIGYELQYSVNGGEFTTVADGNVLSFTHEGLAPGNQYTYRLRAISADARISSDYCAVKAATIKVDNPNLTIGLAENGKPQLTWEKVEGAVSYQVYYATSKSGKYKLVETTDALSYIYEAAKTGKTCYFKVRAVDINGTTGGYSSVKSIKSK